MSGRHEVELHQFVEALSPRDAIGGHVLEVDRLLADLGVGSTIYARSLHPELLDRGRNHEDFRPGKGPTALLYHTSLGSPVAEYVTRRPEPRLVYHHNITPAEMFRPWDPGLAGFLDLGRSQLDELMPGSVLGLGPSRFNTEELEAVGCADTAVVPILIDLDSVLYEPDEATMAELDAGRATDSSSWLFVGRLSPNKAQHDLIKAFAFYRRTVDPAARLRMVGASSSVSYVDALERLVSALELGDAVTLTGSISPEAMAAEYASADIFVGLSEHEGFCVPLLEAWHHGLPIVAFAAAAVPETLGSAGILLDDKSPAVVAAAVDTVLRDASLSAELIARGRERLATYSLERARRAFTNAVLPVLDRLADHPSGLHSEAMTDG